MPIIKKKQKQLKPARVLTLSLMGIIVVGTLLLCLPVSSKSREWTDLLDSFFTAVSATSVTGIALFDTFAHWSVLGQVVILLMMQIGGLGLITIVTFFNFAVGRRMGLIKASAAAGEVSVTGFVGSKRLFIRIITYTLGIELAGAALLCLTFIPEYGGYGVFMAIFMAVSSFCNAGFDVMTAGGNAEGLNAYSDKPQVLVVMAMLIFLGGIGFVVWDNLANYHKTKRLFMHTKLVLAFSGIMLLVGFAAYFIVCLVEGDKYGDMSLGEKLLSSAFSSFSARTAGFSVADLPYANDFSRLATIMLMFVGAAPGSTAGGIKVTTLAILTATVMAVIRGKEDASIYGHRIPKRLVYKSVTVLALSIGFIMISFASIYLLIPDTPELSILYEVISAFTTTGFSTGVSAAGGVAVKLIICLTMFVGRVGPVSLLLSLTADKSGEGKHKVMPDCEILIG